MLSAADVLAALVFPQGCHVCGGAVLRRADGVACSSCWDDPLVTPLFSDRERCGRCGAPGTGTCDPCAPEGVTAVRSAGDYAGALRAALLDLKRRPHVPRRLRDLLAATLADGLADSPELSAADLVVPVPLHPDRLAARGHNQAEALARSLAKAAGLECSTRALSRVRDTARRRGGLGRAARAEATKGAFRAASRLVGGRTVLVVDDLFTTGATLAACARALREAGAGDVVAVTAARARLIR